MLATLMKYFKNSGEDSTEAQNKEDKDNAELLFPLDLEEKDRLTPNLNNSSDTDSDSETHESPLDETHKAPVVPLPTGTTPTQPIPIVGRRNSESDSDSGSDSFPEKAAEYFLNHRKSSQKLSESLSVGSPPADPRTPKINRI